MPKTKFRLKLATLGAPGAGKSSILRWWLSYVVRQPDVATCSHSTPHVQHRLVYKPTVGIDFHELTCTLPCNIEVTLQVWDTAGTPQPSAASLRQYQAMHAAQALVCVHDAARPQTLTWLHSALVALSEDWGPASPYLAIIAHSGHQHHHIESMTTTQPTAADSHTCEQAMRATFTAATWHAVDGMTGVGMQSTLHHIACDLAGVPQRLRGLLEGVEGQPAPCPLPEGGQLGSREGPAAAVRPARLGLGHRHRGTLYASGEAPPGATAVGRQHAAATAAAAAESQGPGQGVREARQVQGPGDEGVRPAHLLLAPHKVARQLLHLPAVTGDASMQCQPGAALATTQQLKALDSSSVQRESNACWCMILAARWGCLGGSARVSALTQGT
ncbi:hypothetical protein V8C86DRAFT_2700737 [Haematococcus lacustris]